MSDREWLTWPDNWLTEWNGYMGSYIEGLKDKGWCVECSRINPHPLFGRPEWKTEYDLGYRYYVLRYNLYDSSKDNVSFYKEAKEAREAFEKARDPLGKHK